MVFVALVVLMFSASCSSSSTASDPSKDLAAGSACEKFTKWRQEFLDGVLSYDETRDRVKVVYEDGQKANSDAIKADTKELLVQVTAKASGKVYFASEQMSKDCLALP
jgi:hypothetical protein